jgi:ComF family protein
MACPRCGAPYGMRQCTECNRLSLRDTGFDDLPFDACVSAALFSSAVARIVRTHKDGGERRLARDMAYAMACAIPSEWMSGGASVVPIPATREAQRSRGFDHGASLAQAVAEYLHAPCTSLLAPPHAKDQRELARGERFANMEAAFSLLGANGDIRVRSVILVDDVFTTGATLFAAASTLRAAGVEHVRCATFARVY